MFIFFIFQKTFTVDEFLHNHRNAATLETIRDDLGVYLKVLRSAMIELINEDYADFVNLSSDLVGLDQSINKIQIPLISLRDEITTVRTTISDEMQEIDDCIEKKRQLNEQSKCVQSFLFAKKSIAKLSSLLHGDPSSGDLREVDFTPVMLERAAMELVQLKHNLEVCRSLLERIDQIEKLDRFKEINRKLLKIIERHFLDVLSSNNSEEIERCLHIFCTLGEQRTAEEILRREIIAPYMDTIISETSLQNSPHGLDGIYKQILQFIDDRLKPLLLLTQNNQTGKTHVTGFDFMLNSFWQDVEPRLEVHMASIFAPGNPDQFYQKYQNTNAFLEKIEKILHQTNRINEFHAHSQYKQLQHKWNLPVYFQIRFQEIGGALELACNKTIDVDFIDGRLRPFASVSNCLNKCWSDGVYLSQIFSRFLKFTMQIYNRLCVWIDDAIKNDEPTNKMLNRIDFLITIYLDAQKTIGQSVELTKLICDKIPIHLLNEKSTIEKCLNETTRALESRLKRIESQWNREMLKQTSGWTKQVADIPRLYRKTNRDAPSKPCNYVEQILAPAKEFNRNYSTKIDSKRIQQCLTSVFSELNKQ